MGRGAREAGHLFGRARCLSGGTEVGRMADPSPDELVTVVGVVHHVTSLGVFLDVGDRRVFVGRNCMEPVAPPPEAGEPATLRVQRWFAVQEGLA
jgi:hypothetical protein